MATDDLPPLIRALLNPRLYPGAVQRVELGQTHDAWVLLAGDAAYKTKKPVQLSFMDFSTLALRRKACETELRVNARYAPAPPQPPIYRAVLPIVGTPEAPRWGQPSIDEEQAIEFAVHMRRFDETARLDHPCESGALQAQARVAAADAPWGHPETVWAVVQDNLQVLRGLLKSGEDRVLWQGIADWTLAQWPTVSKALAERRQQGRVREGHGDLHLANLVLLQGEVLPFDAIEFNEALRWIDVADELAFTWMDLQRLGQTGLAHDLLSEWLDASGDVDAPQVLPFFAVYLAMVRAKVAAIRCAQLPGAADTEHATMQAKVRAYLLLDAAFLRRAEREAFAALARELGGHFAILAPEAPNHVLHQRIVTRLACGQNPSEATPKVLGKPLGWIEPLTTDEPRLPWSGAQ